LYLRREDTESIRLKNRKSGGHLRDLTDPRGKGGEGRSNEMDSERGEGRGRWDWMKAAEARDANPSTPRRTGEILVGYSVGRVKKGR